MPSASTSTFIRPSVSMSSLSHSMKVRSVHRGVADRHRLVERLAGEHEAADMLREMARKADQLVGECDGLADRRIGRIEAGLADVIVRQAVAVAPHRLGQRRGDVLGQAQDLADFADGAARAVMDDGGADRRAMAAVALVDVLDHLLAPLVLEIDVDVGRLAAVLGNEAGEQQVALVRIDRGDAEAKADRAVGRRAAALAEDFLVLAAREGDDVVHGEEVARIVELGDQRELVAQAFLHLGGNAVGIAVLRIALARARPGEVFEMLLRGLARRHRLVGIFVFAARRARSGRLWRSRRCGRWRRGNSANSRAISAGGLRWRSALTASRKPASAMVHFSRMQVTTSASGRRSGA